MCIPIARGPRAAEEQVAAVAVANQLRVAGPGQQSLQNVAAVLKQDIPDSPVAVEGHTDNVPIKTDKYKDNWDLSVGRATTIVRILTGEHNMEPTRLTASGKGEFAPRASNDDAKGRASNRRTEIVLSPRLEELMELLNKN